MSASIAKSRLGLRGRPKNCWIFVSQIESTKFGARSVKVLIGKTHLKQACWLTPVVSVFGRGGTRIGNSKASLAI